MFKSDIDVIKEYTLIIQPEPKEELEDVSPSRISQQEESAGENENSKALIEEKKEDKKDNKKQAPAIN